MNATTRDLPANYLSGDVIETTSEPNHLWRLLGIDAPDPRLRDAELLLRLIAWRRFSREYIGNMKPFLDDTMKKLNQAWSSERESIEHLVDQLLRGVQAASQVFGEHAGRKFKAGRFEPSLNRALFEVQVYYFSFRAIRDAARAKKKALVAGFKELSSDSEFLTSIEATTKSIENYRVRFDKYRRMLRAALGITSEALQLGQSARTR